MRHRFMTAAQVRAMTPSATPSPDWPLDYVVVGIA
jgi:hypothetical protein